MAPSVKLGVHGIDGDKTRYHVVSRKGTDPSVGPVVRIDMAHLKS